MSDITMCKGEGCPAKEQCKRFTATPNEHWQSYFTESPIKEDGTCIMFWGDRQTSILDYLTDIVNGKENK